MTKLKLWQNPNCDKTQIVRRKSKTQMWQNSDCNSSDSLTEKNKKKIKKIKIKIKLFSQQNLKKKIQQQISQKTQTQVMMRLKNSNCDQTKKLEVW